MSNKIKISTAEFCPEGAFTGTITLPNPEYDFGGFLKVWNTNKPPLITSASKSVNISFQIL